MSEFPLGYERIAPITWAYLSSLLMIGLFFKFNRFWSVRNIDLILLILLAPGMLMVVIGGNAVEANLIPAVAELTSSANNTSATATVEKPASNSVSTENPSSDRPNTTTEPQGASEDIGPLINNTDPPNEKPREPNASVVAIPPTETGAVDSGQSLQLTGYIWLFVVGILFAVRMLIDPTMTRRPLLEPNLSTGGLIFIGCSMFVFLMLNVITSRTTEADLDGPRRAEQLVKGEDNGKAEDESVSSRGPGYAWFFALPSISTVGMSAASEVQVGVGEIRTWTVDGKKMQAEYLEMTRDRKVRLRGEKGEITSVPFDQLSESDQLDLRKLAMQIAIVKTMAIMAHFAVVLGIVLIGYRHFDNFKMGVGAATIYLILPYTVQMTGRVEHVIPSALLVWAVFFYRRPLAAGMFIGLAAGVVYYPLFLLPLWISFYWQRGFVRFIIGVTSMLAILAVSLFFKSFDLAMYWHDIESMFGMWLPVRSGLKGLWGLGWDPWFRLPLLVLFMVMSFSFALWPAQKNMGTLLSCSAALMVATQFWHGYGGGLFMGWYLPLVLMTVFRPNLEDRMALAVLGEGWLSRRRRQKDEKKTSIAA